MKIPKNKMESSHRLSTDPLGTKDTTQSSKITIFLLSRFRIERVLSKINQVLIPYFYNKYRIILEAIKIILALDSERHQISHPLTYSI